MPRIHVDEDNNTTFDGPDGWKVAKDLAFRVNGHKPGTCPKLCKLAVVDILRHHIGLGYARRGNSSDDLVARRLAVCHTCPVYQKTTGSCGRLFVDAVSSRQVEANGRLVSPCGCVVLLKAQFKSEHCPGNFWPRR